MLQVCGGMCLTISSASANQWPKSCCSNQSASIPRRCPQASRLATLGTGEFEQPGNKIPKNYLKMPESLNLHIDVTSGSACVWNGTDFAGAPLSRPRQQTQPFQRTLAKLASHHLPNQPTYDTCSRSNSGKYVRMTHTVTLQHQWLPLVLLLLLHRAAAVWSVNHNWTAED